MTVDLGKQKGYETVKDEQFYLLRIVETIYDYVFPLKSEIKITMLNQLN